MIKKNNTIIDGQSVGSCLRSMWFFGHIDPGSFSSGLLSSGLLFTAILETGVV